MRKELIATRVRVIEIDPGQVETVGSDINRAMLTV
jgi:NADP-dependent 3-hydroxy acid dehydrogenase YdfG